MVGKFEVVYLVNKVKEYNSKKYYDVTVMQGDDVITLPCDEVALGMLRGHEMQNVVLQVEIKEVATSKGVYKSFKVIGVEVQNNGK